MHGPLSAASAPLTADEFGTLLRTFEPLADRIAVAVSGGPDSMALAFCLHRWGQRDVTALIVDHGLRSESTVEAATVLQRLTSMGIKGKILTWTHEPILTRIHEKARNARYDLMVKACHDMAVGDLLTGHHRDDQAETILMRLSKGSGLDGLAGMSGQSSRDGLRLVRPFLEIAKERLIATCQHNGIDVVSDASNTSEKFARSRWRKLMPALAAEGLSSDTLVTLGKKATEARDALDYYARAFLASGAEVSLGGTVSLDRSRLRELPRAVGLRVIGLCLRYIHESPYPPDYSALSSLMEAIDTSSTETARTLHGSIASIGEQRVVFLREPAAAAEALSLSPQEEVLWDNRWFVRASHPTYCTLVKALGEQPHDTLDRLAPDLRHKVPQGRARASLPALYLEDKLYAIPSFDPHALFSLRYRKLSFP
jgi:tRNA(Ile)-lysidine synthase